MSIDETAMLLSGQMVRNEVGTFYFDQPGSWTDEDGVPARDHLHRIGGPAIIWANSDQEWYLNGQRHREDGPAVSWANGRTEWWVDGVFVK